MIARKNFKSKQTEKEYKKGQDLSKEPKELLEKWVKSGHAIKVKESKTAKKRQTKELKTGKKTK